MPGPYWSIRITTRAWKNRLYRLPPKKEYQVYITRSVYHYAYARQTQVNWKKETKIRKLEKGKKRKEKERKEKERKEKERKEKKAKKEMYTLVTHNTVETCVLPLFFPMHGSWLEELYASPKNVFVSKTASSFCDELAHKPRYTMKKIKMFGHILP